MSCPRSPVPDVLFQISYLRCPLRTVLTRASCHSCPIPPVLDAMFLLSSPECIIQTILSGCPVTVLPVLMTRSQISCPDCPTTVVPFRLFYPSCSVLAGRPVIFFLFWLYYPDWLLRLSCPGHYRRPLVPDNVRSNAGEPCFYSNV